MVSDRVLFNGDRAAGVSVLLNNTRQEFRARREVILSAGAINSPQILLRSGIGPAADLHGMGIEVIQDLQGVGENLQDHVGVVSQFACTKPVTLHRSAGPIGRIIAGIKYLTFGSGDALSLIHI